MRRVERPDGSVGWVVLIGDSSCGRPFYLGSTLNGHFQDACQQIPSDLVDRDRLWNS